MLEVKLSQRRALLGIKHFLAPSHKANDCVEVAKSLVGFHGTDPATVVLSALARVSEDPITSVQKALYEEKKLLRILAMRRTVWVVPTEHLPDVLGSSTNDIAATERKKLIVHMTKGGFEQNAETFLKKLEADTIAAITKRKTATATELSKDVPSLCSVCKVGVGTNHETEQRLTSRVLSVLAGEAKIVRGKPSGSWSSSQFRWSTPGYWLGTQMASTPKAEAQQKVLARWLATFGPATLNDMVWWTGWTKGNTQKALDAIAPAKVTINGQTAYMFEQDLDMKKKVAPWVALLPALDPTAMGWTDRDWYLGEYKPRLFDRSGNIGPTIWSDGKIVGGWAQLPSSDVVTELFEDIGKEQTKAVEKAAAQLERSLQGIVITPRFRTPTEKQLVSRG